VRTYGTVTPQFWTGQTGKEIRALGLECQVLALYLMTNPHTNALGVYYLPLIFISHETGIPPEGVRKGLASLSKVGFSYYDEGSEVVFVKEMAKFQIGELSPRDHKATWVKKEYQKLPKCPFLYAFYARYKDLFNLLHPRGSEGAWKGLGSFLVEMDMEMDMEMEQDKTEEGEKSFAPHPCHEDGADKPSSVVSEPEEETQPVASPEPCSPKTPHCPHEQIVDIYHQLLPTCPQVRKWGPAGRKKLKGRWREDKERQTLDWWRWYFGQVAMSDFLTGKTPPSGGRSCPFAASLEWLVSPTNMEKVLNGQYENRGFRSGSTLTDKNLQVAQEWANGE
jgi:hypothetical protein